VANNEKSVLRAEFKELAAKFFATHDVANLEKIHNGIAENLSRYCKTHFTAQAIPPRRIAVYEPMRYELPVPNIVSRIDFLNGADFLYPEYDASDMWFVSSLTKEKAEPDFIIVPGLFVDKNGNRLGRGKGYYDRYLGKSALPTERHVFLGYPFQFLEFIPTDVHDVAVTLLPRN
jgi:5,10-methenyltetrahydrofolate synthetase